MLELIGTRLGWERLLGWGVRRAWVVEELDAEASKAVQETEG